MNSRQRRKAYRAMPAVGSVVRWIASGVTKRTAEAVMIGPKPVHAGTWANERGNVPSVHRIRVKFEGTPTAYCHPLVSRIVK